MKIFSYSIKLKTSERFELIDITNKLNEILKQSEIKSGFLNAFSKHTTLAIKINEYEPLLLKDIKNFLEFIAPSGKDYFHDKTELRKDCPFEEPKNAEGHLKCLFLETSQMISIKNNQMDLGKWQRIIVIETSGARDREIIIQIIGE